MTLSKFEISKDAVRSILSVVCSVCPNKGIEYECDELALIKKLKNAGWIADKNNKPICPRCKKQMIVGEDITMMKNKNNKKSSTGCVLQNDWMALYENAGTEFSVEGDRNSNATACLQYFKRKGIKVKVLSRTIDGVGYLTVIKK